MAESDYLFGDTLPTQGSNASVGTKLTEEFARLQGTSEKDAPDVTDKSLEPNPSTPQSESESASTEKVDTAKDDDKPYTTDEWEKMLDDIEPEGLSALDQKRMEEELSKKMKAADKFFQRRATEVKAVEQDYRAGVERLKGLEAKYAEALKEYESLTGEKPAESPELKMAREHHASEEMRVHTQTAWQTMGQIAKAIDAKGFYDPQNPEWHHEIMEGAQAFPKLEELAKERNGYFSDVALAAMVALRFLKAENLNAYVGQKAQEMVKDEKFFKKHVLPVLRTMSEKARSKEVSKAGKAEPSKPQERSDNIMDVLRRSTTPKPSIGDRMVANMQELLEAKKRK